MDRRWRSFKKIDRLWSICSTRHNLLTYASAIALRMFIAAVACTLFGLGILGATHQQQPWRQTIGPTIAPKVLPDVFDGIDQTVIFGAYVRSVADFRTSVGSLEVFIFLATYFYISAFILLVAMELDELVRADLQRPRARQKLLPLVAGVIRG